MALYLVTAPTQEPITVAEAKASLRVDHTDEDAEIGRLVAAAREHIESYTGRALLTQTWDLKLECFPSVIVLPRPPIASVTSITYLDAAGASQTWASANYLTDLPAGPKALPGRITPIYAGSYPTTYDVMNAVTVRYVAGWTKAALVPAPMRTALLQLVNHWYDHRTPVVMGKLATMVPETVTAMLWPYRVFV